MRLAPIDGESLPGYLRRYACTFGISPVDTLRVTGLLGDAEALIAATGYPMRLSEEQAARFCTATGLDRERVALMLLSRFKGIAFAALPPGTSTNRARGVLAHDVSLWKTRACPDCLRADGAWLLHWLLRWVVVCVRHERLLLSLCPACQHPFLLGHRAKWPRDDRGPEQGATSCWESPGGKVCRYPLHEAESLRVGGDQPLIAAHRRIDGILDGQTTPTLAGKECEPLQYLYDLRALVRLNQDEEETLPGSWEPTDTARVAALLPKALAIADAPNPEALCDAIRAMADKHYAESGRVLPKLRTFRVISPLLRDAILHASHTASYAPTSARFGYGHRHHRRPVDLHPKLEDRHVPQLYWREDYDHDLAPLFEFDDFSPWMARRLCSVLLVRMLTPADWATASRYLGLPEHFKHNALYSTVARFTGHGSLPRLLETIKRTANDHAASGGLLDYEQRRTHLATWQGIDTSTWPYLQPSPRPDARYRNLTGRCAHASVWLWCELTSGHELAAPLKLPGDLNSHREFKERHLDEIRDRLLTLGHILLDTPTAAPSTIRKQLAGTHTQ